MNGLSRGLRRASGVPPITHGFAHSHHGRSVVHVTLGPLLLAGPGSLSPLHGLSRAQPADLLARTLTRELLGPCPAPAARRAVADALGVSRETLCVTREVVN